MEQAPAVKYEALAREAWAQAEAASSPEARNIFTVIAAAYLSLAKLAATRDERAAQPDQNSN